jgi:hypothetical protein
LSVNNPDQLLRTNAPLMLNTPPQKTSGIKTPEKQPKPDR